MFKPEDFFCINTDLDNASIEVKVNDNHGWSIWGHVPDSFTPEDLEKFAHQFLIAAHQLRNK